MTHVSIFLFILAMCVTFLICAFRAEDRAWEWEKKYRKLRSDVVFLVYELTPTVRDDDPEFLVGCNMSMGHIKSMVRQIRKHA